MANFNFNKVILGGRLASDPEMRATQSGVSMASFSIAVNRRFQSKDAQGQNQQPTADFFNCTAWRQQAEFVCRYFKKGSSIFIVGSIQNRSYTDQQGQKRTVTDIVVDEVNFVDSKGEGPQIPMGGNAGFQQAPQYQQGGYDRQPQFSTPSQNDGGYAGAQPQPQQPQFEQSQNNQAGSFEELKFDDDLPF